jgi:hypothetical protein
MKKWFLRLGIPLFVLAACYSTDAVMTARAVLAPNARYGRTAPLTNQEYISGLLGTQRLCE